MRKPILAALSLFLVACGAEDHQKVPKTDPGVSLPGGNIDRRSYLGQTLYARHCAVCHGKTGAGDGFNSFNLDPKPRDLRGVVDELGDEHVRKVILDGSISVGQSSLCPPRRHTLRREQPGLLLRFVGGLEAPDPE
jgi:hypothetical protein